MHPILATFVYIAVFLMTAPTPKHFVRKPTVEAVDAKLFAGYVTEAPEIEAMKNYSFAYLGVNKTFGEFASGWEACPKGVKYYYNASLRVGRIQCDITSLQIKFDEEKFSLNGINEDEREKHVSLHSINYVFIFNVSPQGVISLPGSVIELTWQDGTHRQIFPVQKDNYDADLLKNILHAKVGVDFGEEGRYYHMLRDAYHGASISLKQG